MPDALLPAIQPAVTRGTIAEGNKGARFSLEEVARKASEGRNHPVVQAWTTHCLRAAGDPQTAEGMAKAILDAQRKQMVYKSDPLPPRAWSPYVEANKGKVADWSYPWVCGGCTAPKYQAF